MFKVIYARYVLAVLMTLTTLSSPVGAFSPTAINYFSVSGVKVSGTKLAAKGIHDVQSIKFSTGETGYRMVDKAGQAIGNLIMPKTAAEQLKEFAPSKIRDSLSYLKNNAKNIAIAKITQFPTEALSFFVAIGAVTVYDLVVNGPSNPVAMQEFLDSQKDPIGQLGFAAFMVVNGLSTEPLMAVTESKKLSFFINYLGMTMGMMASHVVTEVGHFPGLRQCVRDARRSVADKVSRAVDRLSGAASKSEQSDPVCDEAFKAWAGLSLRDKGNEFAPSLFAMLSASALLGTSEWALSSLGSALRYPILSAVGMEITMSLVPGGWIVRVGRWVYKTAQMGLFVKYSAELEAPFAFAWKNAVQLGPALNDADHRLGVLVANKIKWGWKEETLRNSAGYGPCAKRGDENCYSDLDQDIENFQDLMDRWRAANLQDVQTKFQRWSQFLQGMFAQYHYSKLFYIDFVSELKKRKLTESRGYLHGLDRSYPLFGVRPNGFTDTEKNKYLYAPDEIERRQMETVASVVKWIEDIDRYRTQYKAQRQAQDEFQDEIQAQDNDEVIKSKLARKLLRLPEDRVQEFDQIKMGLSSKHPGVVGEALRKIRLHLGKDQAPGVHETSIRWTRDMTEILEPIYKKLGGPNPMMEEGRGYLRLLAQDADRTIGGKNPFPDTIADAGSLFVVPVGPEYLVFKMIFGPDPEKGEKSISLSFDGFPESFDPPQIRWPGDIDFRNAPYDNTISFNQNRSIFSRTNLSVEGRRVQGSILDYLKDNVRPSVFGDQGGGKIGAWWDFYMETQLENALHVFSEKYAEVIKDFHKRLFFPAKGLLEMDGAWTNPSPFSNAVVDSIEQERNIYLYILGSLSKTINKDKWQPPVPEKKRYSILKAASNLAPKIPWVEDMKQEWKKAQSTLDKIKWGSTSSKDNVTTEVLNEHMKALEALLEKYEIPPGLTKFELRVVNAAKAGLRNTHRQLLDYGKIINNVSVLKKK